MKESDDEELGDELRVLAKRTQNARRRLKLQYAQLYSTVSEILFRHDPIGINFEENTDEYEPEVDTILPRLHDCTSVIDVRRHVYQEFIRWFDPLDVGSEEKYQKIAEEIWIACEELS